MKLLNLLNIATLSCVALLCACSPNHQYRTDYTPCVVSPETPCELATLAKHNPKQVNAFDMAFIEFDDQGQLRDRLQMETVLNTYAAIAAQQKVIVAVFAHGWHHSAAPGDSNVAAFSDFLERLSEIEHQSSTMDARDERRVLGVYIGWRGDSSSWPVLSNLSFWGRKATAHQVGLYGVAEVLLRLEELTNTRYTPEQQANRMVVLGHSFGGALMYTGLQQILADRYINSYPGKNYSGSAHGFGDLVVLLNPAFEAMRYATLYDLSQNCYYATQSEASIACRSYQSDQRPRLAILTSESDRATRTAFPLGRFFSTLFETHTHIQKYHQSDNGPVSFVLDESTADKTAVGHFETFHTHILVPREQQQLHGDDYNYRHLLDLWEAQQHQEVLNFEQTQLVHLGNSDPHNPYLNIYVDEALIPNHNDIWGEEILRFLHDLITLSTLPAVEHISH